MVNGDSFWSVAWRLPEAGVFCKAIFWGDNKIILDFTPFL